MDPEVAALVKTVSALVTKFDHVLDKVEGLFSHFTSIDADYVRMRTAVRNHEARLARLEDHLHLPQEKIGEDSALFPALGPDGKPKEKPTLPGPEGQPG